MSVKLLLLNLILVAVLISPVIYLYFSFWQEFHIVRTIRDAAHFSLSIDELWGKFLSPGLYLLSFISVFGFFVGKRPKDKELKLFAAIFFVATVMALGPVLKYAGATVKLFGKYFLPLPYGVLYYIIPGFGAFRTPSRWLWISAFAAAGIIAVGFRSMSVRYQKIMLIAGAFIAIIGGASIPKYTTIPTPQEYPQVYHWLKTRDESSLIELPIYSWGDQYSGREFRRMLYSLEHRKDLVNGASGFSPPDWEKFVGSMNMDFPAQDLVVYLQDIGADLIIVHKNEYDDFRLKEIETWGADYLIWQDKDDLVYKI